MIVNVFLIHKNMLFMRSSVEQNAICFGQFKKRFVGYTITNDKLIKINK